MITGTSSAGHGLRRVPAQRGLGDVLGQVAHPLEVGRDVQRGDHHAQVGGDRGLAGQQVVDLVLDLVVELVDLVVAGDDPLGLGLVGARAGRWWRAAWRCGRVGHRHQEPADLGQLGLELGAHVTPTSVIG